jgi:hypothetical protein
VFATDPLYLKTDLREGIHVPRQRKFKSARFKGGDYEKSWTEIPEPRKKWEKIIFWVSIAIGFVLGGLICYMSVASVANHEVCPTYSNVFLSLIVESTAL